MVQTDTMQRELFAVKDRALEATRKRDRAFYGSYLTDDPVAVVPAGTYTKAQIVDAMGKGAFQSSAIDDEQVHPLGADAGVVTYVATFGEGEKARRAFVTTIYRKLDGAWRGVFYQQTPLTAEPAKS